ncbi:MAG: hypothetical protein KF858_15790 [Candidatus Sumerlaeia bacterium]|nr:hypothetical protein [Candidatus Sumerlaeia bacterium]
MAPNPANGKVYRIHVSGGQNNLSMLICVFASEPLDTLGKYLAHAAVITRSKPVPVPTMNGASKGIDLFIGDIKKAPGYEILNRLQIHPIDRTLVGAD